MSDAVAAQNKPPVVELEGGRAYAWCSCGRSGEQPFCGGSHSAVAMQPIIFRPEANGKVQLCGCKATRNRSYCDGSHHAL